MHVSLTVWIVTIAVLAIAVGLDLWHGIRYPHAIKTREAAIWVSAIVAASLWQGIWMISFMGVRLSASYDGTRTICGHGSGRRRPAHRSIPHREGP